MGSKRGRPWLVPVIIVFSLLVAWLVVSVATRSDGDGQQTATEGTENVTSDTAADDASTATSLDELPPSTAG